MVGGVGGGLGAGLLFGAFLGADEGEFAVEFFLTGVVVLDHARDHGGEQRQHEHAPDWEDYGDNFAGGGDGREVAAYGGHVHGRPVEGVPE